jgi:phosphopantothenoylcysteine decarboxylase/phosphopantothenate--cysteine ligase
MEEPEMIVEKIKDYFQKKNSLSNKTILITAGPTYEKIDAVRFIGNQSSGKMGYSIAEECANRGAKVVLISGPVNISPIHPNIQLHKITSAEEMHKISMLKFKECDAAILAAAVADFSPETYSDEKIKRKNENLCISLIPTKDIAADLGKLKKKNQVLIGFSLETNNEMENAIIKLKKKNLDFIVLNTLKDNGAGFNYDTNKITIINNKEEIFKFELKQKNLVAKDIIDNLEDYF